MTMVTAQMLDLPPCKSPSSTFPASDTLGAFVVGRDEAAVKLDPMAGSIPNFRDFQLREGANKSSHCSGL